MEESTFHVDTDKGFDLSAALQLKPNAPSDERIPYHTLSFDFQGNGLSGGTTSYGNYYEEVENIRCIVTYVRENLNRKVLCICGHSKGAAVVLLYASKCNDVPLIVSLSARYDHTETPSNRFSPEQLEKLQKKGSFVWLKKGNIEYIIREDDLKKRNSLDMSVVESIDKQKVKALTIHGSKDEVIPVNEAYTYDKLIGPEPYHKLVIVQDANHCFDNINHQKIMTEAITSWLDENKSWAFNEI
ncbi:alpha/beta-Hydrolases superfamily protein [Rhizophagus clarus]|uniref:Alpha/beta-Hydrolases superfamily protein n=1 Tax=Rhizophagus clarus TaxID=94130 RepID=A0A8H3QFW7_9GLOM|nr:alpha/beta-Hydrolases superfamily protein [Rhizophagus clarus]